MQPNMKCTTHNTNNTLKFAQEDNMEPHTLMHASIIYYIHMEADS